eukprot:scaffold724_cov333-Prasinococcus_capsulatus_cf.AAC.8
MPMMTPPAAAATSTTPSREPRLRAADGAGLGWGAVRCFAAQLPGGDAAPGGSRGGPGRHAGGAARGPGARHLRPRLQRHHLGRPRRPRLPAPGPGAPRHATHLPTASSERARSGSRCSWGVPVNVLALTFGGARQGIGGAHGGDAAPAGHLQRDALRGRAGGGLLPQPRLRGRPRWHQGHVLVPALLSPARRRAVTTRECWESAAATRSRKRCVTAAGDAKRAEAVRVPHAVPLTQGRLSLRLSKTRSHPVTPIPPSLPTHTHCRNTAAAPLTKV